jgi:hypothetical protein
VSRQKGREELSKSKKEQKNRSFAYAQDDILLREALTGSVP